MIFLLELKSRLLVEAYLSCKGLCWTALVPRDFDRSEAQPPKAENDEHVLEYGLHYHYGTPLLRSSQIVINASVGF